jgi:hypothetical protein
MLVTLWELPQNENEWARWSFAHRDNTDVVRQAVRQQLGVNLSEYSLDPIPFNAIQNWLAWNQNSHNDINDALGTQGSDLQDVDFTDPRQLEAWVYLHVQEHTTWCNRLKVA